MHPHSQEVLSLNLNGFILYKKLSEATECHVRSVVPSAGPPPQVRPAELTAYVRC